MKILSKHDPTSSDFEGPCPRCKGPVPNRYEKGEYAGALSRFDNTTYICSSCGTEEALMAGHLIPLNVGLYSETANKIREGAR